jgi:hypothetical protein
MNGTDIVKPSTVKVTNSGMAARLLWLIAVAELAALVGLSLWWLSLQLVTARQLWFVLTAVLNVLVLIACFGLGWWGMRRAVRARFRFRLRTLLCVIAAASIYLVFLVKPLTQSYELRRQRLAALRAGEVIVRLEGVIAATNEEQRALAMNYPADYLGDNVQFYEKRLTDADLEALAGHPNLHWIILRHCEVSETGIHFFTGAKKLRYMDLTGTTLSDDAIERIKTALPNCKIKR